MRYHEIVETFDQPSAIEWETSEGEEAVDAIATLDDGTYLSIMFSKEFGDFGDDFGDWSIEFHRNNSQEVTGEGHAQQVFATVLEAIRQFVKKYKPNTVTFSASKEVDMDADNVEKFNPESRAKLYNRLVQRYASAMGYTATQREGNGKVTYTLRRAKQGMAENTAAGINKMFNNLGDPVYANLQRVALLAMQGRQQEAAGRLQTVIKHADPAVQKKITDAVNNIKPVTINGRVADSSTLDKSKQHNDWIINTFIPWVQSLLGEQGVTEAPLADYQPLGDFNKPGPFRGADKKLIPHPVNQLKAQKFFEKTPFDFRLFFSNISGTGKYSEYGVMDPETVKIIFGDAGEQIVTDHENAITVVYVGNSGDSKVMLTPWMMAHRLGHAIQSGTRGRATNQQHPWKAGEDHFFGQVNSMLEQYYGKSGQRGGNLKAELTPEYNALFNAMGTQRSSRSGEIRRPYEFLYEIFAQYLGTGTVSFNALPVNLGYGRQAWGNPSRYLNIKPEYRDEAARKQAAEVLSYDMELMFNDALSDAVGKILVM